MAASKTSSPSSLMPTRATSPVDISAPSITGNPVSVQDQSSALRPGPVVGVGIVVVDRALRQHHGTAIEREAVDTVGDVGGSGGGTPSVGSGRIKHAVRLNTRRIPPLSDEHLLAGPYSGVPVATGESRGCGDGSPRVGLGIVGGAVRESVASAASPDDDFVPCPDDGMAFPPP